MNIIIASVHLVNFSAWLGPQTLCAFIEGICILQIVFGSIHRWSIYIMVDGEKKTVSFAVKIYDETLSNPPPHDVLLINVFSLILSSIFLSSLYVQHSFICLLQKKNFDIRLTQTTYREERENENQFYYGNFTLLLIHPLSHLSIDFFLLHVELYFKSKRQYEYTSM